MIARIFNARYTLQLGNPLVCCIRHLALSTTSADQKLEHLKEQMEKNLKMTIVILMS